MNEPSVVSSSLTASPIHILTRKAQYYLQNGKSGTATQACIGQGREEQYNNVYSAGASKLFARCFASFLQRHTTHVLTRFNLWKLPCPCQRQVMPPSVATY